MTTFVMEARENYDPTNAALIDSASAQNQTPTDPTDIGNGYDFNRRMLMYLGLVVPGVNKTTGDFTNTTGFTLFDGLSGVFAPSATMINTSNFSPQVAQKSIDTDAVTFFPTYSASQTVPANVGSLRPLVDHNGSGYTHAAVTITPFGSDVIDMTAVAIVDAGGGGAVIDIKVTKWNSTPFTGAPTFAITGDGTGATVSLTYNGAASDGTWRWVGVDFSPTLSDPNAPNLYDPRLNIFWVHAESCELYPYALANNFAQTLAPASIAETGEANLLTALGVDTTWCYGVTILESGVTTNFNLALIPAAVTAAETTASAKLPYVIWDTSPFSGDWGLRLTFGTDGNVYLFSLFSSTGGETSGNFRFRLTQFQPPALGTYGSNASGTMTDVTPWSTSTGPDLDGANYSLVGGNTPEYTWYIPLLRLPATGEMATILKFPKEASASSSDYTNTLFSCCYIALGGSPTYDYHSGFVTGYMDDTWTSVDSIPVTGWAVVDCRETNPYLEQSDYVYSGVDYTRRWFVFQAYPISGSTVGSNLQAVLVEYQFVSGAPPVLLNLYSDPDWDTLYAAYGTAIGVPEVVCASMVNGTGIMGNGGAGVGFDASADNYLDPGIYDVTTNTFWFSGLTKPNAANVDDAAYNYMFNLNPVFTARAAYNNSGTDQNKLGGVTPPFLMLSTGFIPPPTGVPYSFGEII